MEVEFLSQETIKKLTGSATAVAYGLAVLVVQCIYIIVPLRRIISNGFMAWMSPALAVSGIAIFVISGIVDPKRYLSKELIIPWIFIIVLIASSASNYERGLIENIKTIIWQADLMLLIFPSFICLGKASTGGSSPNDEAIRDVLAKDMPVDDAVASVSDGTAIKAVCYAAIIVILIWDIAVVVSLIQFFQMSDYTIAAEDGGVYRQGFSEGRLFGIFTAPYKSSIISSYTAAASICMDSYSRRWADGHLGLKLFCIISCMLSLTMIVLSGARSVMLGMMISCFVVVTISLLKSDRYRNSLHSDGLHKLISVSVAIAVAVGSFAILEGYGRLLRYTAGTFYTREMSEPVSTDDEQESINIMSGDRESQDMSNDSEPQSNDEYVEQDEAGSDGESSLERSDISGDISNNRFYIWKDYIHVFMDKPPKMLLGYSPCGYMEYIDSNYQDLYIVQYVKWKYPLMYELKHEVYETHNSVLTILISTGFAGLALLIALIVQSLKHIAGYYIKCKPGIEDYCMLAVLLTTAVALMFESDIFYQCSATSVVFWMVLGAVFGRSIGSRTSGAVSQTHNKDNQ